MAAFFFGAAAFFAGAAFFAAAFFGAAAFFAAPAFFVDALPFAGPGFFAVAVAVAARARAVDGFAARRPVVAIAIAIARGVVSVVSVTLQSPSMSSLWGRPGGASRQPAWRAAGSARKRRPRSGRRREREARSDATALREASVARPKPAPSVLSAPPGEHAPQVASRFLLPRQVPLSDGEFAPPSLR